MAEIKPPHLAASGAGRPWDARLARRLVTPLRNSWVTPNHLTTVRLAVGLGAAVAFVPGTYGWSNVAAFLLVLSNFLDHTDGELARISGKTSRFGHWYDLASDALVTVLLFIAIGVGISTKANVDYDVPPVLMGAVSGIAIALIFFLRMRIEEMSGKTATRQGSLAGFETEDVLYLLPLATLCNALAPVLVAGSICAPLHAVWAAIEYRRSARRAQPLSAAKTSGVAQ